jgi:hypothetical protein
MDAHEEKPWILAAIAGLPIWLCLRQSGFAQKLGACWQPQFKGHTMMINGNYNGWRFEDAWLDE